MFGRLVDVAVVKNTGEALVLVNHKFHPNTFICSGTFNRYESTTETDSCTLSIYNLSAATRGALALGGYSTIIIRYGYSDNTDNLLQDLFVGVVQRITFKRRDAATTETKIWILDTGDFRTYSFFSGSYANGVNYYQIAYDLSHGEYSPESVILSEKLKQFAVNGNKTFFGSADSALQEIAAENGFIYKRSNSALSILTPEEICEQTDVIPLTMYNETTGRIESTSGLIGYPELTDDGLYFECLINTRLRVHSLVRIDNSVVSISQEGAVPNAEYGAILDPDGLYIIVNISGNFSNDNQSNKMRCKTYARSVFLEKYSVS